MSFLAPRGQSRGRGSSSPGASPLNREDHREASAAGRGRGGYGGHENRRGREDEGHHAAANQNRRQFDDEHFEVEDSRGTRRSQQDPYRDDPVEGNGGGRGGGRGGRIGGGGGPVGSSHRESHGYQEARREPREPYAEINREDFNDGRRRLDRNEIFNGDNRPPQNHQSANNRHNYDDRVQQQPRDNRGQAAAAEGYDRNEELRHSRNSSSREYRNPSPERRQLRHNEPHFGRSRSREAQLSNDTVYVVDRPKPNRNTSNVRGSGYVDNSAAASNRNPSRNEFNQHNREQVYDNLPYNNRQPTPPDVFDYEEERSQARAQQPPANNDRQNAQRQREPQYADQRNQPLGRGQQQRDEDYRAGQEDEHIRRHPVDPTQHSSSRNEQPRRHESPRRAYVEQQNYHQDDRSAQHAPLRHDYSNQRRDLIDDEPPRRSRQQEYEPIRQGRNFEDDAQPRQPYHERDRRSPGPQQRQQYAQSEHNYDEIPHHRDQREQFEQDRRSSQQRQPVHHHQEVRYYDEPLRSGHFENERDQQLQHRQQPNYEQSERHYDEIPHRDNQRGNDRDRRSPQPQHQPQQQQQRQHYAQSEHHYDEIPLRNNQHHYERPHEPVQQQPQRVQANRDVIYHEPPPGPQSDRREQNYDYPPSDHRHVQQQDRTIYDEPPLQHGYSNHHQQQQPIQAHDDPFSIETTVHYAAAAAAESRSPAARERTVLPEPKQYNVRLIKPRQRHVPPHNSEDPSFAETVQNDHHQDELVVEEVAVDPNEGWDSPVPTAQPTFNNSSERGGRGGDDTIGYSRGGGATVGSTRGGYSSNTFNQQQQPQFNNGDDDFIGVEEGDPAPRTSYRPRDEGLGGFSSNNPRGNYHNLGFNGRRDYDAENYDFSGRRDFNGNGYSGFQPDSFNQPPNRLNRAPIDYVPKRRELENIYREDIAELNKYGNTICAGDAEVNADGPDELQQFDNWEEMDLNPQLLKNIRQSEYIKPRNIQKICIPYIREGLNLKCRSETGSGKTVAFLVPIIDKLISMKETGNLIGAGPFALIIAPTRELVYQLFEQALKLTNGTEITVSYAFGQYNRRENVADVVQGCNILCGCVGRLYDFINDQIISLRHVRFLVLDEPDRLLHNFGDDIEILKIINHIDLPHKDDRQTLLFSATLDDPNVIQLDENINLDNLVTITANKESNVRLHYEVLAVPSMPSKFRYLIEYLKEITAANDDVTPKTLVFVNKRIDVDRAAIDITNGGFPATTIHGGRSQDLREEAYEYFRNGKAKILVATDVCCRGVDIHEMDYVINYDLPEDKTTFVQRCGRTGRTHDGTAISFYCEDVDLNMAHIIYDVIANSGHNAPEFLRSSVSDADFKYGKADQSSPFLGGLDSTFGNPETQADHQQQQQEGPEDAPTAAIAAAADDDWN